MSYPARMTPQGAMHAVPEPRTAPKAVERLSSLDRAMPWLFTATVAFALWGPRLHILRMRLILACVFALFAAGLWHRREELARGGYAKAAAGLFMLSLVATGLPMLMIYLVVPWKLEVTGMAERASFTLLGWTLFLWLPPLTARPPVAAEASRDDLPPRMRWLAPAAVVLLAFAVLSIAHAILLGDGVLLQDEALYLLQAKWLWLPQHSWHFDRELEPFFRMILTHVENGRMYSQYPPGWGATLALFSALGLQWWSAIVMGTAAVLFTYLFVRRLHSERVAILAALLLATQHWFIEWGAGYFGHAASTALATSSAWLLLEGESRLGRARTTRWIIAGSLLGWLLTIRPLTAVTLGTSLVVWLALRNRLTSREWWTMVGQLALGGLAPTLALLYYNSATTGNPFRFGYDLVNGELHSLGFGTRGYRGVDATGAFTTLPYPFTLGRAIRHLGDRMWELSFGMLPLGLLLPIVLAARALGVRIRWAVFAAFMILPAAYFFYFDSETRFYTEMFPFLYAGVAALLIAIWKHNRNAGRILVASVLAANAVFAVTWQADRFGDPWDIGSWYLRFRPGLTDFANVEAARQQYGKIVVFVREENSSNPTLGRLFVLNRDGLKGDVVIARDLGARNALLLKRLPSHTPVLLDWDGDETHAGVLSPLPAVDSEARKVVTPLRSNRSAP